MAGPKCLVAAGFIIFRRLNEKVQYLLLQHSYGEHHWTPPKGHVDPGESEFETALRETQEEAGLEKQHMNVIESFVRTLKYEVRGKPKRVVYWLSELKDPTTEIKLSHEHQDFKWLEFEEAFQYAHYKEMQQAYSEADQFIREMSSS